MLDIAKRFFNKATAEVSEDANQNTEHDIRVATCALLVEMARIDEKFADGQAAKPAAPDTRPTDNREAKSS